MKRSTLSSGIVTALFLLALLLPLVFTRLTGAEVSEEEKRMLAGAPLLISESGGLNPALKEESKAWFEDHIGFRRQFVRLASDINFYVFRRTSSDLVKPGARGWYYYNNDSNLEIATGEYPLPEEKLEEILRIHLAIRDKLAAQSIEYLILMPTSKISIYPEYAPVGDGAVRITPVDIVADYLEQNSDLRIVRLKGTLLEEKEQQQVFFKTDTHWTFGGAYAAYLEIIERLHDWGLCDSGAAQVTTVPGTHRGEFGAMMGVNLGEEKTVLTVINDAHAVSDQDEGKKLSEEDEARSALFRKDIQAEDIKYPCFCFHNAGSADPRRVMFFGDSMFGGWNLPQLFAENYAEFLYVWNYDVRERLIEDMQPDIVIYEITERYLNYFPYTNGAFLADTAA